MITLTLSTEPDGKTRLELEAPGTRYVGSDEDFRLADKRVFEGAKVYVHCTYCLVMFVSIEGFEEHKKDCPERKKALKPVEMRL